MARSLSSNDSDFPLLMAFIFNTRIFTMSNDSVSSIVADVFPSEYIDSQLASSWGINTINAEDFKEAIGSFEQSASRIHVSIL